MRCWRQTDDVYEWITSCDCTRLTVCNRSKGVLIAKQSRQSTCLSPTLLWRENRGKILAMTSYTETHFRHTTHSWSPSWADCVWPSCFMMSLLDNWQTHRDNWKANLTKGLHSVERDSLKIALMMSMVGLYTFQHMILQRQQHVESLQLAMDGRSGNVYFDPVGSCLF